MPAATPLRRWLARGAAIVVVGWMVFALTVVLRPTQTRSPVEADAIFVLAGPGYSRISTAISLAHRLHIDQVAISVGETGRGSGQGLCRHPPAGVSITCFMPDPNTTRGEAQALKKLTAEHNWHNVIVVTIAPHISRARMILGRCFSGTLQMVAAPLDLGFAAAEYQLLYQTGGFLRAALTTAC